jgi:hypothetical protein
MLPMGSCERIDERAEVAEADGDDAVSVDQRARSAGRPTAQAGDFVTGQTHEEFAAAFVSAVNADDEEQLRALVHRKCLAQITEQNEDFYTEVFLQDLISQVPEDYGIDVTPIGMEDQLLLGDQFDYPVRPTHDLRIDFAVNEEYGASIAQQLAPEGDHWAIVIPCPSADTLAAMRESGALVEDHRARAEELIKELKEPLLGELKELLGQGRTVEAYRRYSEATGEVLITAKSVLTLVDTDLADD